MKNIRSMVLLCGVALPPISLSARAEDTRLLVLDNVESRGVTPRLLLVDAESGAVVAEREAAAQAIIGLSLQRDIVGVISRYALAGVVHRNRAEFYQTDDKLTPLESGYLPVPRTPLQSSGGYLYFTADGGVIIQRMEAYLNDEPQPHSVSHCWLYPMTRELNDAEVFKLNHQAVKVPRCTFVNVLRVADWPRAVVWNPGVRALYTINFEAAKIESRVGINDDPLLQAFEPTYFEQDVIAQDVRRRLVSPGIVHTFDGRTGYYVPQQPTGDPPRTAIGFLRKIDLTSNPPKIIQKSKEPQPNLRAGIATVAGGGLFVVRHEYEKPYAKRSNRIRVFDTRDFTFINELQLSVSEIEQLVASNDEKYVYALSPADAKIAVVDVQTGEEVKVLEKIGTHPVMVFPLPSGSDG